MKALMVCLIPAGLAVACLSATPAYADDWSNAVDVCQGSLPSFEGALRKRPLAIANEGTSSSFLSCSLRAPAATNGQGLVAGTIVVVTNRSASAKTVSCTLVDGAALPYPSIPPTYHTKSIDVGAGGWSAASWTQQDDNANSPYRRPNLNCSLPVGVELNSVAILD